MMTAEQQTSDVKITNMTLLLFYCQSGEPTGSEVGDHHLEAGTQVDSLC